jgi:hypothetical protein
VNWRIKLHLFALPIQISQYKTVELIYLRFVVLQKLYLYFKLVEFSIVDKTPTHAPFIQHYIILAC